MKALRNIMIFLFFSMAILIVVVCCLYNYNLKPVDKNSTEKIVVEIPSGASVKNIGTILKEKDLIKSAKFFSVYCRIYKVNDMKATTYTLSKSMSLEEIVKTLQEGNSYNPDEISITFQEGINMRKVASIIAKNTNNKEADVYNLLKDTTYLDELIKNYWFIDESIKNPNIYYSLEGYLYPNTYKFKNKDVTVKEIFKVMLDQMGKVLEKYKGVINGNKYSVHEILTLSSIVELEGKGEEARRGIAAVFYNRLNHNMSLGSDVTTYYAAKVEMSERDLRKDEIDAVNAYNTRSSSMVGKLPVGPISNPSESSIKGVLYPEENSPYYYFVADKNGNVKFTKTYQEHLAAIQKMKDDGVWYEWN